MLSLPLLQLMMLVSPSARSPHGPAIRASRRYAEPRCGACADFCIGRLGGYHSTKPEDFEGKCARASGRALHRLRGGARIRTGKRTSNVTWATFPRSFFGWYCLGVAMLGEFGLLWPGDWKKSDSIKFALIGLVHMSLDAVLDAFFRKN